jgi:hypothetical protein
VVFAAIPRWTASRWSGTVVRLSQLVAENPRIKEIDINPLLV